MAGKFAGLGTARANAGGIYLKPGDYELEVEQCKSDVDRKKNGNYIVEFKILSSNNSERAVGSRVSWYQGFDKDGWESRVKGFLLAIEGVEEDALSAKEWEDLAAESVSEKNPYVGRRVVAQCYPTRTRGGIVIDAVKFFPAEEK